MRDYFIKHQLVGFLAFVILTFGVFCYGNVITSRGGILENVLLNEDDVYFKWNHYVEETTDFSDSFKVGVKIDGLTKDALKKLIFWTNKFRENFGESVVSLSSGVLNTRVFEDEVSTEPYIAEGDLQGIDLGQWKKQVENDPIFGFLVEKDWSCLYIFVSLQKGYDDSETLWKVAEILEESKIPWWKRLWKTDIHPKDPSLMVSGWPVARGLLYQILNVDMARGTAFGIIFLFSLFRMTFLCWKQALFSTLMVVVGIAWMRGSIGILNILGADWLLGSPIKERVYILAAFTNIFVQGVSFALHKFESYNNTGTWLKAKKVDSLILTTGAISFFGFITLWTFEVRSIRELGLISSVGVLFLCLLSIIFIPSLCRVSPKGTNPSSTNIYLRALRHLSNAASRFANVDPRIYLAFIAMLAGFAIALIFDGQLTVGTKPLDYIPDTLPEKSAKFFNAEGRSGFSALSLCVEPKLGSDTHDPVFINKVYEFQIKIQEAGARKVFSVVDLIRKLGMQLVEGDTPLTREVVDDAFLYIDSGTYPEAKYQLWTNKRIRVLAFMEGEGSVAVAKFNEAVLEAAKDFPELKVSPFGETALYPREDKYIREGKPQNAGWSQIVVIGFCILLIMYKNLKLGTRLISPVIGGIIMSLPFVFASSVTVLLMMALRIPLDVTTAMITALAINASVDFSIYYVDAYQEALVKTDSDKAIAVAMDIEGGVIINDILLNSACFLPLIFSHFIPISRIGWMTVIMIIACGISSLVIMPSIFRYAVRKKE